MSHLPAVIVRRTILLAAAVASFTAAPLTAQNARPQRDFNAGLRTGVGYSGVMPDAILGIGAYHLFRGPMGVFADLKATAISGIRHDDEYCPPAITQCTAGWVVSERNDQLVNDPREWLAFNAGIVYAFTPEFALLLGGGMARESRFREYFDDNVDPDLRVTFSGAYFVDDDVGPEWKPQAVGGVLLRAGRNLAFRVSYESAIGGLGVGAYVRVK